MNKQYHLAKKPYLPPRVVAVAFKVEDCFVSGLRDMLIPTSDDRGMESYNSAANSGSSFWDSDLSSGGQTEGYSSYNDWSW